MLSHHHHEVLLRLIEITPCQKWHHAVILQRIDCFLIELKDLSVVFETCQLPFKVCFAQKGLGLGIIHEGHGPEDFVLHQESPVG